MDGAIVESPTERGEYIGKCFHCPWMLVLKERSDRRKGQLSAYIENKS